MTDKICHATLQPIGRGTLHAAPTCNDARQESLRAWAVARRGADARSPVDAAAAVMRRASPPRR